jgi:hypothetical protein
MALRPEYSLGHSQYNDFLFAWISEGTGEAQLTVLSALTRLGLDPWQEAASLSDMPRKTAARVFALTIAGLPDRSWTTSEVAAIAARLVNRLPLQSAPPIPAIKSALAGDQPKKSRLVTWLIWGALAIAVILLALHR